MGFDHIHTQLLPLPPLRPTSHHLQLLLSLWNQGCALDCGYLPRVMSLKKTHPHSCRSHPLVRGSPLEVTPQAQSLEQFESLYSSQLGWHPSVQEPRCGLECPEHRVFFVLFCSVLFLKQIPCPSILLDSFRGLCRSKQFEARSFNKS